MPATPGAPLPFGILTPTLVVQEAGDYENADGCRLSLVGGNLIYEARIGGTEMVFGLAIEHLLEAIGAHTRAHGN